MKRVKIITITAIIYIGLILGNTQVFATDKGTTINDTTRMREKASTSSSTVTLISINEEVEIISQDGDWYKVKYTSEGKTYSGYIRSDMLKTDYKKAITSDEKNTTTEETEKEDNTETTEEKNSEGSTEIEENVESTQEIEIKEGNTSTLKSNTEIKILPLINSNTIAKIEKNTKITIEETLGSWTYIESEEQAGWVITSKLQENIKTSKESKNSQENEQKDDNKNDSKKKETTAGKKETKTNETSKTTENTKMYISSQTVNLRKEANSSSAILKQLSINTQVTVVEKVDNKWSKIKVDGITGYIATEYLSKEKTTVTSRGSETSRTKKTEETKKEKTTTETEKKEETSKTSEKSSTKTSTDTSKASSTKTTETKSKSTGVTGSDIVAYAKKYLGYKYVLGGTSPKTGFDCSGLVYYVYGQNGYTLSRTSTAQASNGKKVSKSNLKEGDLIIFNNDANTKIGHVGIYIGGGKFIHAANPSKGVIISSLSESYYSKRYVTARRIIN